MRINDVIEKYSYKCVDYLPAVRYTLMPFFKRSPTPPPPVQETPPPRRRGVGALFSSSRAADNAATTTTDSHTNDNGSTTGTSRIGGFFRRRSTGGPDVDSTRDTQRRRGSIGSGTAPTDTAARTGSQARRSGRGTDRSLDAARHKVTLAEKAEKEADA